LAVLSALVASLSLFTAPSAHALGKVDTGVWWRNQTDATTLPAPPQVPAGGLWVSSDPTGPSAISAFRFALSDTEGFPTLALRVAKITAQPATAVTSGTLPIRACAVTHDWAPPATFPGKWSARPGYDCTKGSVPGQLSPDRSMVVFDLTVLPAAPSYDLVVVSDADVNVVALPPPPAPVPDPNRGAGSPTFDITFEPVKPSDLAVFPTSPPQAAEPAMAPATAAATADSAVGPAPLVPLDVAPASAAVPPSTPAARPAARLPRATRAVVAPVAKLAATSRVTRVLAGVVFCALAAWAWRLLAADGAVVPGIAGGREALSLYDPVSPREGPGLRRRFGASPRIGVPPALR
jgi:hypothetical protein